MLSKEAKKQLVVLADSLDAKGLMVEADMIDQIIKAYYVEPTALPVGVTLPEAAGPISEVNYCETCDDEQEIQFGEDGEVMNSTCPGCGNRYQKMVTRQESL